MVRIRQPAELNDLAYEFIGVLDKNLVVDLHQSRWRNHASPVLHQTQIVSIGEGNVLLVVGKIGPSTEVGCVNRHAGIDGIATQVNEVGVRKKTVNQPYPFVIERLLVDNPFRRLSIGFELPKVGLR